MEKLQTLLWILLGVGVFVWRMIQKAREAMAREQRERPKSTGKVPPLPTASFQEMLKQMQAQNTAGNPATASAPAVPANKQTTPAGRPLPQEKVPVPRSLEQTTVIPKSLEKSREARSLEVPLHEARRAAALPRANTQHGQEDYWSRTQTRRKEQPSSSLADRLRNPADLRAAFVLGEILQRRF
ncbi:hypothetical protein MTX78_12420 [Hymenobacter tibetensis]|uniref:Uncharacterized protein n=1 Tax=Hymenobacter tibetensis TaxID=497967 RepID=A0ABY4CRN8_9BACT|nr:hypothetical protein [Hymenobacter tibetensis]UOG72933.1 hypothetical protein MTX78_12420 [Hymenobacter tibetensis]